MENKVEKLVGTLEMFLPMLISPETINPHSWWLSYSMIFCLFDYFRILYNCPWLFVLNIRLEYDVVYVFSWEGPTKILVCNTPAPPSQLRLTIVEIKIFFKLNMNWKFIIITYNTVRLFCHCIIVLNTVFFFTVRQV